MSQTFYAGPGKPYLGTQGFEPEGTNGAVKISIDESSDVRGSAMHGDLFETVADVKGKIDFTAWDNWNLLPTLFPTYLGVTTAVGTGFGPGVLAVGTDPFTATKVPAGVWTPDGRLYNFVRGAITKHPSMKLMPGAPLFSGIEITALGDLTLQPGATNFLMSTGVAGTGAPITESAGTDPGTGDFGIADFGQTHWTAAWGAITGFTGMEAEDGWDLVSDVKYNFYQCQKVTRVCRLASARFMIKGRIVGPTHTQLLGKLLTHANGAILSESAIADNAGAIDLVLTGSNGKTITLKNCEVKGAGFDFGGSKLGTGEVGFVTKVQVAADVASPSLVFST